MSQNIDSVLYSPDYGTEFRFELFMDVVGDVSIGATVVSPQMLLQYHRDDSLKRKGLESFSLLDGPPVFTDELRLFLPLRTGVAAPFGYDHFPLSSNWSEKGKLTQTASVANPLC